MTTDVPDKQSPNRVRLAVRIIGSVAIVLFGLFMTLVGLLLFLSNTVGGTNDVLFFIISELIWFAFLAAAVMWTYFGARMFVRSFGRRSSKEELS